jgi:hypothetical protein
MQSNVGCWRPRLAVLVIVTSWLTGCTTVGFDTTPSACPPTIEYSQAEQARVADEVAALPDGTLTVGWLADYAVLRDQARMCRK